jgi:hypothetical protein
LVQVVVGVGAWLSQVDPFGKNSHTPHVTSEIFMLLAGPGWKTVLVLFSFWMT